MRLSITTLLFTAVIVCSISHPVLAKDPIKKQKQSEQQTNKSQAQQNISAAKTKTNATPSQSVTINSRVTGSTEQPKVIYVMPWQGINQAVDVNAGQFDIKLPAYQPINPKQFKQQVEQFHQTNKSK
ncbi:hypothetical protein [Shewanella maritima]|uniref:hypothetical protein n=1 Tax=Shewanella maritima TaxID=2520507 RepID=UPI00373659D5